MATKTKKETKFNRISFSVEDFPGCCGLGTISYFSDDAATSLGDYNYASGKYSRVKVEKFDTRKAQAKNCLGRIISNTWPEKGRKDGYNDNYYAYLQIALVSNYADKRTPPQFPALQELLITEDWTIQAVFINPNHGNEITVFTKHFPERDQDPYKLQDQYYDEEDEEDEVY